MRPLKEEEKDIDPRRGPHDFVGGGSMAAAAANGQEQCKASCCSYIGILLLKGQENVTGTNILLCEVVQCQGLMQATNT